MPAPDRLDDQHIRRMLAEASERKARELAATKAEFRRWMVIAVPAAALVLALTLLLRTPPERGPAPTAASPPAPDTSGKVQLNGFLETGQSVPQQVTTPSTGGPMIDKEDLQFANELFGFLQPETPPPSPGK